MRLGGAILLGIALCAPGGAAALATPDPIAAAVEHKNIEITNWRALPRAPAAMPDWPRDQYMRLPKTQVELDDDGLPRLKGYIVERSGEYDFRLFPVQINF